ncbi:hypothetical protein BG006_004726 [Podila minutissima]|uniref:Uncharacterized protein n=1 Tax=Podila minutissima TaxID=64525 RepID=A0A9P5VMR9_9FUNG|nr:hypothetical protein BG006_004726 [Podila minutissima]
MLLGLKGYFEDSAIHSISLVSFMRRFPDIHEKDRIIKTWQGALNYLQRHSSSEKRQLYESLRKYTSVELEKIVDGELQEREHDSTILVNVSQQELATSRMHTKQVEERFDADINSDIYGHIYGYTYNQIYDDTYSDRQHTEHCTITRRRA